MVTGNIVKYVKVILLKKKSSWLYQNYQVDYVIQVVRATTFQLLEMIILCGIKC